MIVELDETIRKLLTREGQLEELNVLVSFEIPNSDWSQKISAPTLNCYLFDIRENRELRQHGRETVGQGSRQLVWQRPPMRFDLTYLVTAWTRVVEDEHRLLWHALQTLTRFETIPSEYLQEGLAGIEEPIFARTALPDSVLKSPGEFWTALDNQLKPSLSYVVTLAVSREALLAGQTVFTSQLRFKWRNVADDRERWVWFGGVVRDSAGKPVAGAEVAIEERGLSATADDNGRFRMRVPEPGRYLLTARFGGAEQQREIEIPDPSYDIRFESAAASGNTT